MKLNPKNLKRIRISLSVLLTAAALLFVTLSLLSAANYTEVAYAKLSAKASADVEISAALLEPNWEVGNGTVFWFNVVINVSNPSARTIRLQSVTYQGSLKDYITLDLYGSAGQRIFYSTLIRTFSSQPTQGYVAPGSSISINVSWAYSNTESVSFQGAKRILNYALTNPNHGLRWDQVDWNHFFVFHLIVTGIPTEYYGPNSSYLIEIPVIIRYQGDNTGVI